MANSTSADEQARRQRRAEYKHRYYETHREQIKAYSRAYYRNHREHLVAGSRQYQQTHRQQVAEYARGYARKNRAHIMEYDRAYRQTNLQALHKKQRAYRESHPRFGLSLARRMMYLMDHPEEYVLQVLGVELRPYQAEPLGRILESIEKHLGDTFVIMFPRQSGKDEFLLNLMVYLSDLYSVLPVSMVAVNPTYKPQTQTAMLRFDRALQANTLTRGQWRSSGGFMRSVGQLRIAFLSGEEHANVAGATASLLLIVNEAQDVSPQVYHQKFEPMAASTNATRILAGTAWTSRTLLAQEMRLARQAEKEDGRKRVYTVDAEAVRKCVPWYGAHVDAVVRAHGRGHPMVKTQYFNEEIDAQTGMFNAARRALMAGDSLHTNETKGKVYAFCIDVGGMDEAAQDGVQKWAQDLAPLRNAGRDSTTLSVVEIDLSTLETLQAPTYRVVRRRAWIGANHLTVFGQLKALAGQWRPQHIVVDATGVGEGLWAMLDKAFPTKVLPVKFSAQKKSEMGYRFISLIETGRFKDCCDDRGEGVPAALVERQYAACQAEVLMGPGKTMRWGVPEGARDENGELIHDDIVLADALVTEIDELEWTIHSPTLIVKGIDPLDDMSRIR